MIDTHLYFGRRNRMVKDLAAKGSYSGSVLEAIGRVARHRFLETGLQESGGNTGKAFGAALARRQNGNTGKLRQR